jgi:DNA adenine methylase
VTADAVDLDVGVPGTLRAPFPWFGGKSRAARIVWDAFGDVTNYVEPFAGSLAVLLARPHAPRVETVNDLDCYLANFWRAVQAAPDDVARWADWPVNEADLHARHRWLVGRTEFRERMATDPDFHDAKVAGWWVWGICQWIGSGWCVNPEWRGRGQPARAMGINARAIERKRPVIARGGRGVYRQKPHISGDSGASGIGIHGSGKADGMVYAWMHALAARLRRVRVCCGDWARVLTRPVTTSIGVTGVLLDPPYADTAGRNPDLYARDDLEVAHRVRAWALEHGDDPRLRLALCGYDGEHQMPASWRCVAWTAHGGYGNSAGNANRYRERVWLSPHCLTAEGPLFDRGAAR